MTIELKMPALSPTMEKGNLARWLVAEGDRVKPGDMIAEIETDKATMEFEAVDEGRISGLLVPEGANDVTVGTVIALIVKDGKAPSPAPARSPRASPSPPIPVAGNAEDQSAVRTRTSRADRIKVSPLASRIAIAKNIDLGGIVGTGPQGRIVRADLGIKPPVQREKSELALQTVAPARAAPAPPSGVPVETIKLGTMRKTIARRLSESKQTVPHFYLTARCNLDPLLKLRDELNAALADRGIKLSVNDLLMKAMALALVAVPDANVQFGGDNLYRFSRVDISMAVAIEGGLITPIVHDVASRSLSAIAETSKTLAAKARDGKLTPEDYQGGTASISNLGMFGIDEMFPVINPPQALILGIGAGVRQPWDVDGEIALATILSATASFDHRAIDGATAAQFMQAFREHVEQPMILCL